MIVLCAFLCITEDFVGFVDLLELFLGASLVLGDVGVVLPREFAEGFFDVISASVASDTERCIVVFESDGPGWTGTTI